MSNILIKNGKVITSDSKVLTTSPSEAKLVARGEWDNENKIFNLDKPLENNKFYFIRFYSHLAYWFQINVYYFDGEQNIIMMCKDDGEEDLLCRCTVTSNYILIHSLDVRNVIFNIYDDGEYVDYCEVYELPFTLGGE